MSDELKIKFELPDAFEDAAKALTTPLAGNAGTTMGDLWFLAMGGISQAAAKRRVKYALELEEYKKDLEKKLNNIPAENRIEPNTQVVLNALADSQSCVEEKTLREMFANLITAACNADKADAVHPAFPGIIKQMSTLEAELLVLLGQDDGFPIVNICAKVNDGKIPVAKNVFMENTERYSLKAQDSAVACLSMLGLIEVSYLSHYQKEDRYMPFKTVPLYTLLETAKVYKLDFGPIFPVNGVILEKGRICLTSFGRRFLEACL